MVGFYDYIIALKAPRINTLLLAMGKDLLVNCDGKRYPEHGPQGGFD